MNRQVVLCTICQEIVQMPGQAMRQSNDFRCKRCVELQKTFSHRHSLSIDLPSLDDVNTLTGQLKKLCDSTTWSCTSSHSAFSRYDRYEAAYWLSCTCESISLQLLNMLASLHVRFMLRDMVTQQDVLQFWPGDAVPRGVLFPLVMNTMQEVV